MRIFFPAIRVPGNFKRVNRAGRGQGDNTYISGPENMTACLTKCLIAEIKELACRRDSMRRHLGSGHQSRASNRSN